MSSAPNFFTLELGKQDSITTSRKGYWFDLSSKIRWKLYFILSVNFWRLGMTYLHWYLQIQFAYAPIFFLLEVPENYTE